MALLQRGLMDTIVKANDQGKIKIKKVTDNTAAEVEIQVDLAPGISPDITIDALYKFTDCESFYFTQRLRDH